MADIFAAISARDQAELERILAADPGAAAAVDAYGV